MQHDLLAANRDVPVRVYAVWFNMYPGDARDHWRAELLTDARVRHYWDQQRSVGRLFLQFLPRLWPVRAADTVLPQADALWDAYLLYPAEARWDDEVPVALSWGSTILQTQDTLERELGQLIKR